MTMLNYAAFEPLVGDRFTVRTEEEIGLSLVLDEAVDKSNAQFEQFSLIFSGPADRFMPQKLYPVSHENLGEHLIFLVPVGEIAEEKSENRKIVGYQYQAVFNRLRKSR